MLTQTNENFKFKKKTSTNTQTPHFGAQHLLHNPSISQLLPLNENLKSPFASPAAFDTSMCTSFAPFSPLD